MIKDNDELKQLFLDQLKKTPVIQLVCEKINVSRASYYRWRDQDPEFIKESDAALIEGRAVMSDIAETQLLNAIHSQNLSAILFYLKTHSEVYSPKLQLSGKLEIKDKPIPPEQMAIIRKAVELSGIKFNNDKTQSYDTNNTQPESK
ncbi:MAG: phBC6A51 family helix-turn-helix protein [Candidatus Magasanikbacteria bacterium]|jgi:hypothetical protein